MAKESLADRIKAGPLSPKWKAIVAKNKEINDLKGDVDGSLAEYDKNLQAAADATKAMQSAWDDLAKANNATLADGNTAVKSHEAAYEKMHKEFADRFRKTVEQADKQAKSDIPAAMDTMSKIDDGIDNYAQNVTELYKALIAAQEKRNDGFKKAYEDANKKIDQQKDAQKKLEDACNKIDDDVRKTITDMQKQAIKASKDKVADAMGAFLKQM